MSLGKINADTWESALVVPANASLGWIVIRATAYDAQNMSHQVMFTNVSRVVDSPPTWFGPHVLGVDADGWNNASSLPNRPAIGLFRHVESSLTACVSDADYRVDMEEPFFLASRGTLGNITYVPQNTTHLYCYTAPFSLAVGSSLDDVEFELRSKEGSLLLQRTVRVADKPPQLQLHVESSTGELLDRVVGNGEERVVVSVTDVDDPNTSFVGDISVQWPGSEAIQWPLDIPAGTDRVLINLSQLMVPLEGGDVLIEASGIGQNGGSTVAQLDVPFLLTPPEIVLFEACDEQGSVESMTFGQTAILLVGVASDRPLEAASAQLMQLGWSINAPPTETILWDLESPPAACNTSAYASDDVEWLTFRLKLDNSMVDGDGKAVFSVTDLDGLVKSTSLDLVFQHAPTEFVFLKTSTPLPEQDMFTNLTLTDLDGLDSVICTHTLSMKTVGCSVNRRSWQVPRVCSPTRSHGRFPFRVRSPTPP